MKSLFIIFLLISQSVVAQTDFTLNFVIRNHDFVRQVKNLNSANKNDRFKALDITTGIYYRVGKRNLFGVNLAWNKTFYGIAKSNFRMQSFETSSDMLWRYELLKHKKVVFYMENGIALFARYYKASKSIGPISSLDLQKQIKNWGINIDGLPLNTVTSGAGFLSDIGMIYFFKDRIGISTILQYRYMYSRKFHQSISPYYNFGLSVYYLL